MNKAERCHAAMDYRRQGLNCSQCLVAAFRVKEYQRRFTERFHRLDCRELLRSQELEPSELALELAGSDHCGRLIVTAAEILTDMLEEA